MKISVMIVTLMSTPIGAISTSSDSEVAEDVDDEPSSLQWLSRGQRKSEKPFKGPTPGPKQPVSATNSPLHVFYEICPESIFELIENDYIPIYIARRQNTDLVWTEKVFQSVTAEVMKAYVGIRMIMGIDQKTSTEDYWSTNPSLRNIRISETMSRRTFKLIQRYFHINDPFKDPSRLADLEKAKQISKKDQLYKVSTLLEAVRQNSIRLYNLHQEFSID